VTTFQAIIYGIIHGFAVFLPISASAHHALVPYLLGWPEPTGAFLAALYLGTALSVFCYFIHDWASIISSFIQVILFRKKPMTLDERLPLFLACTAIPIVIAQFYLKPFLDRVDWTPALIVGLLALGGWPLFFAERRSRKNKGMFDWNWLDALTVGITGIFIFIPGGGSPEGFIPGALLRNYNRESAAKYGFFVMFPLLATTAYVHFHDVAFHGGPAPDLTWLSFGAALVVSFFSGLLAIGGLMKHVQRNGFGQYVIYRTLLAIGAGAVIWLRSR
jgi:undecaprenyl-diphosphatase